MRELSAEEQTIVLDLLSAGRFDRALVSLALWAVEPSKPSGPPRERDWNLSDRSDRTSRLGPDDFEADDLWQWRDATVLHLLKVLDERLHGDWQASHRNLFRLSGGQTGQDAYLIRRRGSRQTRSLRMVGLRQHLRHFDVIPARLSVGPTGPHVELHPVDDLLDQRLDAVRDQVTGFIGHFAEGVAIDWQRPLDGYVLAAGLHQPAAQFDACSRLLDQGAGATFFVLPECTVPADMRREIAIRIGRMDERAPLLSVPGSFHDTAADKRPAYENRCEVYDARGCQLLSHQKTEVASVHGSKGMEEEYITAGATLHALATDIGLVGIAICLEFSEPKGSCHAAWSALAPAWMLVPSMGAASTLELHRGVALQLHQTHRTVTLVANQAADGLGHEGSIWPHEAGTTSLVNRVLKLAAPPRTKVN